jgi:hypothetical protein
VETSEGSKSLSVCGIGLMATWAVLLRGIGFGLRGEDGRRGEEGEEQDSSAALVLLGWFTTRLE